LLATVKQEPDYQEYKLRDIILKLEKIFKFEKVLGSFYNI